MVADVSNRAEAQMNIHKNARTILQSTPDGPPRCCGCEGRDSGSRLLRQRANRAQMGVALAPATLWRSAAAVPLADGGDPA